MQVSPYLAQDFVAADSLDTVLREHGPAPGSEALRIITQIAGGLDYAAVVGVVHGALHPRDVLISPDDVRITGPRCGARARAGRRPAFPFAVRMPRPSGWRAARGTDGPTCSRWQRWRTSCSGAAASPRSAPKRRRRSTSFRARRSTGCARRLRGRWQKIPAQRYPSALEFADALKSCFTERQDARPAAAPTRDRLSAKGREEAPVDRRSTTLTAAAPLLPLQGRGGAQARNSGR